MNDLVWRWRRRNRPGRRQRTYGLDQVLVEGPLERFQTAALRVRQVVGQSERAHVGQNLVEVREPSFELGSAWCEDRRRIGSQDASRVDEDRAPVHLVGDAVRRHEDLDVRGSQPMRECGLEHEVLVPGRQGGQRVRRRWPKTPGGQFHADPGRQPLREMEASRYPARPLRQQVRHRVRSQAILFDQ